MFSVYSAQTNLHHRRIPEYCTIKTVFRKQPSTSKWTTPSQTKSVVKKDEKKYIKSIQIPKTIKNYQNNKVASITQHNFAKSLPNIHSQNVAPPAASVCYSLATAASPRWAPR